MRALQSSIFKINWLEMESTEYLKVLREKVLSDCRPDTAFWTCHGKIIRNIYELADSIDSMNDPSFMYHVNDDNQKNDFAKWISEALEDGELGHSLKKIRDKGDYVRIIRERIKELESVE